MQSLDYVVAQLRDAKLVYFATPYTRYVAGLDSAAGMAAVGAAALIKHGLPVFSPIAHTHTIGVAAGMDLVDHDLWKGVDAPFVDLASALIVCCMQGWAESRGVTAEVTAFAAAGKPVFFVDPADLGIVETKARPPLVIGFTGKRGVGKSEAAKILVEAGYLSVHALGGGRVAAAAYFEHLGAEPETAWRMVYGDLKDAPSEVLPGKVTPRDFLEPYGKFMGTHPEVGPDWTLGAELRLMRAAHPDANIVAESVVYEADVMRAAGGLIVRIVRPGVEGPKGAETDKAEAEITADKVIVNDGTLEDLKLKLREFLEF